MGDHEDVTAFVIGDPHFKENNLVETREMALRCAKLAKAKKPTFVVVLGDTLHYHNVAKNGSYKAAYYFIEALSNIAPVYILVGNHDYINQEQYLTDDHFFLPYRKWTSVSVVDRPICVEYGDYSFVMCPYVPPGRFETALNELVKDGHDWQMADCIFAHQEFRGCVMGAIESSTKGDVWDVNYPPVISGHIHDSQTIGENVFYTGTPIQHSFGEKPDKKVWFISFGEEDPPYFEVEKIDLGMKGKKTIQMPLDEIDDFKLEEHQDWTVRLILSDCSSAKFRAFRQGGRYRKLTKAGVKITFENISKGEPGVLRSREEVSYTHVLREVVKKKGLEVQNEYVQLFGESLDLDEESQGDPSSESPPETKTEDVVEFISDSDTDTEGVSQSDSEEIILEDEDTEGGPCELVFCED